MNILIDKVRISGFRGISNIEITLPRVTVLLGQNNAGKTSVIKAMQLAMGDYSRYLSDEDFHIGEDEKRQEAITVDLRFIAVWICPSLFKILCKCLFSEVTVQAVTELDNKAAHCHSPVLQRHRPFLGRRLDCQPHHFFHRVVCREHFTLFDRMADHAV